ncbi:MAG: hypothetical protein ACERLM_11260, partial [Acidimicrobiales bacterium]
MKSELHARLDRTQQVGAGEAEEAAATTGRQTKPTLARRIWSARHGIHRPSLISPVISTATALV